MRKIDFSDIAVRYEDFSLVQRSAGDLLLNLLDIGSNEDVLDLGCGAGNLTRKIREITKGRVIGVDPSEGMIKEAIEKNRDLDITFGIKSGEVLVYQDCFDVIFCNSAMQWFKAPERIIKNCHTALRKTGRVGVQAPAKSTYSPNFIHAIEKVKKDQRTKDIFSHFKNPWFFCETSDEYKTLFEMAGFNVAFSKIDTIKTIHTPEDVYKIFSSGAVAGYLNRDFYDVEINEEYIDTFKQIIRDSFTQQANNEGMVELIFNRLFLIAVKR